MCSFGLEMIAAGFPVNALERGSAAGRKGRKR
jgi:hypothetical protein